LLSKKDCFNKLTPIFSTKVKTEAPAPSPSERVGERLLCSTL
jgi:hypothetical protein